MERDPLIPRKQSASAFWKAYFAKFRRRVSDREVSETSPAALSAEADSTVPPLSFPDRRRAPGKRHGLLR